jgi:hypothetical protein
MDMSVDRKIVTSTAGLMYPITTKQAYIRASGDYYFGAYFAVF